MALVSVQLFRTLREAGLSDDAALEIAERFTPQSSLAPRFPSRLQDLKSLVAISVILTMVLVIKAYWS